MAWTKIFILIVETSQRRSVQQVDNAFKKLTTQFRRYWACPIKTGQENLPGHEVVSQLRVKLHLRNVSSVPHISSDMAVLYWSLLGGAGPPWNSGVGAV